MSGGSHIFEIKITEVTTPGEIFTLSEHSILSMPSNPTPPRFPPRRHVIVPPSLKRVKEASQEHLRLVSQHMVRFAHINTYKNSLQAWAFLTSRSALGEDGQAPGTGRRARCSSGRPRGGVLGEQLAHRCLWSELRRARPTEAADSDGD